jgi:hypothetical protein
MHETDSYVYGGKQLCPRKDFFFRDLVACIIFGDFKYHYAFGLMAFVNTGMCRVASYQKTRDCKNQTVCGSRCWNYSLF